jgi:hypothetical protein
MTLKALLVSASLGAALLAVGPAANATTYTGVQNIGGETVDLSITTNGVLGLISQSDITGFNVSASGPAGDFDINSTDPSSEFSFNGFSYDHLVATPTALTQTIAPYGFSFGSGQNFIYIADSYPTDLGYICIGNSCGFNSNVVGESVDLEASQTGQLVLPESDVTLPAGTVVTLGTVSAAPEPSAWALMIAGIGLVGGMMRHRARRTALLLGA